MRKCTEKGCNGEINESTSIPLTTNCGIMHGSCPLAYACRVCGRLYLENGKPVFNSSGKKAFLKKNELVVQV